MSNKGWKDNLNGVDLEAYRRVSKMSKKDIQAVFLVWKALKTFHPSWWQFEELSLSRNIREICKDIVKENE